MPTGGVTLQNAAEWISAGAVANGVGTALVDRKAVAGGRFELIAENARRFVDAVRLAQGGVAAGGAR
jgi:2-dehydro-3-deoxyphosphogluconate aldolase/(4S)-4-hydroxy-2-oxoglutarate aldolase